MLFRAGALLLLTIALGGCLPLDLDTPLDLTSPRVGGVSLGGLEARVPPEATALAPIALTFSEPLDPTTVDPETVLVIEGRTPTACEEGRECWTGTCINNLCQSGRVDSAFRSDANNPPLSQSRQAWVHPCEVALDPSGLRVVLRPRRPLVPSQLYSVLISGAVADRAGNPLVSSEGHNEGFAYDFVTSQAATERPSVTLVWPRASTSVAPNITRVVLGFSGPVQGVSARSIWLTNGEHEPVSVVRDGAGLCADGEAACLALDLVETLAPASFYRVAWGPDVRDGLDRPVPEPTDPVGFFTAEEMDRSAPVVDGLLQSVFEGCLQVRFTTDESARASAQVVADGTLQSESQVGSWATVHHLVLDAPPTVGSLYLRVWDPLGNEALQGPFTLAPQSSSPAVVISEVLANPAGPEPSQEWVEVVNRTPGPVDLSGWRLTDDMTKAGDPLPPVVLAPGAVALIVPAPFDAAHGADPLPDVNAVLVRISGANLGSAGLSNSGEAVYLIDASDVLQSAYPGGASVGLPDNGQSVLRHLGETCSDRGPWIVHPDGSSSPGRLDPL